MKLGIVGLPNVGKSTLFNAITSTKNAEAANYPFCTIEPNSGIVAVPDKRLDKLADDKNTSWRVSEQDVWQNKHYDKCMDVYEQYLCDTNQSRAPWYLVDAKDK